MKEITLALLTFGIGICSAHADDLSVQLNQCQKKALAAVQIKASKKYKTTVVLSKIDMIADTGNTTATSFLVDVEIGTYSNNSKQIRYQADIPSFKGECISIHPTKVKFISDRIEKNIN